MGPVLGPHARASRTRDTRVAKPGLPAPEDELPGKGQRLTPDAPHNGGRPAPRGRPPTTPTARSPHRACKPRGQCWAPTPAHLRPQHVGSRPRQPAGGRAAGGGGRPDLRRPSQRRTAPSGDTLRPLPRRASTTRKAWGRCWAPTPTPTAPRTQGMRNPGRPSQRAGGRGRDRPPPPGKAPRHPHGTQPHTGHASQGDSAGPPHSYTRAHSTRVAGPGRPPRGGQPGGGGERLNSDAPHNDGRHPGTPFRRPHSTQRRLARAPRCGAGAGTATTPAARSPHRACRPRGQCWASTPAHPRPQHVGGGPWQPPGGGQPEEGERLASDAPRNRATHATRAEGGAPNAHTNTRTPARKASVRAAPPTPHRAHRTCTSHGKSAPHPLLLGTATQQWRNPRPHAKHAPDLRRWTRHMRSSGRWDSEAAKETPHRRMRARTPTWR